MRIGMSSILALVLFAACDWAPTDTATEQPNTPISKLEVFATGAKISGANGMHFGPDGMLYVASVIGSDLTVLDPDSGEIIRRHSAADGVIGPDDVAFASDGSYYWTSILTGEVAGFDTKGNKVIAAQLAPGSNPITFSDDDRLFVSQCFLGHNLYELDPTGETEPRLLADDLGPGCGLNGMDWGPDNRLYGPRWFTGEVISVDVDTGERRVEATGFQTPAAIKFDSQGVLHVLDTATGELIRMEDDEKNVIASFTPGLDNFAFDKNDTPYVSSYADGFVKRVNDDGSITDLAPGGLSHPGGIAVIGDIVWVADIHAVRGFHRKTGEEIHTHRNVVGVGELGGSLSLAADGDNLILTSWFDGDARIWDPEDEKRLLHLSGLAAPVSAARYSGGLAIAEHATSSVKLYQEESDPVLLYSGLSAPAGLVVDGGDLLVSDRTLGEIKMIARDGVVLTEPETVLSGLQSPEGFVVTENGYVVFEADAARLIAIEHSGQRRVLAEFPAGPQALPGLPPSQVFNDVAMDADGNLFFTGEAERVLYRIQAPW